MSDFHQQFLCLFSKLLPMKQYKPILSKRLRKYFSICTFSHSLWRGGGCLHLKPKFKDKLNWKLNLFLHVSWNIGVLTKIEISVHFEEQLLKFWSKFSFQKMVTFIFSILSIQMRHIPLYVDCNTILKNEICTKRCWQKHAWRNVTLDDVAFY